MARLEQDTIDMSYKTYVTKSLQIIPEHKQLTISFNDMIDFDKRSTTIEDASEVAQDIIQRAGLTIE